VFWASRPSWRDPADSQVQLHGLIITRKISVRLLNPPKSYDFPIEHASGASLRQLSVFHLRNLPFSDRFTGQVNFGCEL
jgi:hypothetical protein